jgi:hypothetical protein
VDSREERVTRVPAIKKKDIMRAYQIKQDTYRQSSAHATRPPRATSASRVKYHQPEKPQSQPLLAGSDMSATLKRLADEKTYTGVYKKRLDERDGKVIKDLSAQGTGELCASPSRARRLLKSTPVAKLNMPRRSGDFRTEVEWRLQLRPNIES